MLIEREAEVRALRAAFFDSESSRNSVVLIEGPVGCGKSELLHFGIEQAVHHEAFVLEASGSYQERKLFAGILRQLGGADIHHDIRDRLCRLVDSAADHAAVDGTDFRIDDPFWSRVMHSAFVDLSELAQRRPVVIAVDDLHHVDEVSLQFLKYLVRRSRGSRLSFLLTIALHQKPRDSLFEAELLRQPAFARLSVGPLSRDGVARLLDGRCAAASSRRAVDEMCALTGGNPLLLRAVTEERSREGATEDIDASSGLHPGGLFTQALQTCLVESGPEVTDIAAAFAVLESGASVRRAGRMLGIDRHAAERGVACLRAAGLVTDSSYRHVAVRTAVYEGLAADRLAELHQRAAELLHDEGECVSVVADHVAACGSIRHPWGLQVLVEAAESALGADRAEHAVGYLEAAVDMCGDDLRRAEIRVRLAEVVHRVNPTAAEPFLDQALAAARRHQLSVLSLESLARMVRSRGYVTESALTAGWLSEAVISSEARPKVGLEAEVPKLSLPAEPRPPRRRAATLRGSRPTIALNEAEREFRMSLAHAAAEPALLATTALWTLPGWGADAGLAIRVVGSYPSTRSYFSDMELPGMLNVVKALAFADRSDAATRWCEALADECNWRGAPGWRAWVSAVHAEVLLLQGRFAEAEEEAAEALADVPPGADSAYVAGPIACRVLAATATGRYEDASRYLSQSLPERVHRTVDGFGYLRARGRYLLAIGHAQAALDDFLRVGRRAAGWGIDRPELIPWRIDAAETWLRLGEKNEAERLITEQAAAVDVSNAHTRGMILRLRASTAEPPLRRRLLTRAVGELQRSGDIYELAKALVDLGHAHQAMGDRSLSEPVLERAWRLANECGAKELCEQLRGPSVEFEGEDDAQSKLSESERRVASLAAFGHTNREIASQLHVTVSTVEQHLTRVYRKLNIARRQELPPQLRLPTNQVA